MIYYSGIFCGSHYEIHSHDIIAVDFDGVLFKTFAPYDPRKIGDPIWPMIKRVKKWISEGKESSHPNRSDAFQSYSRAIKIYKAVDRSRM